MLTWQPVDIGTKSPTMNTPWTSSRWYFEALRNHAQVPAATVVIIHMRMNLHVFFNHILSPSIHALLKTRYRHLAEGSSLPTALPAGRSRTAPVHYDWLAAIPTSRLASDSWSELDSESEEPKSVASESLSDVTMRIWPRSCSSGSSWTVRLASEISDHIP
jgi:hypothetical protein